MRPQTDPYWSGGGSEARLSRGGLIGKKGKVIFEELAGIKPKLADDDEMGQV